MNAEAVGVTEPRLLNRQLSWLAFNRRVLALAEDPRLPYVDRMRFVSIWAGNLDEYFQVRVADLKDDAALGSKRFVDDGMTAASQLAAMQDEVARQLVEAGTLAARLWTEVREVGVQLVRWDELTAAEAASMKTVFTERVFPVLTPLAVDPGHPFPYISTLSLSLGLLIADPSSGIRRFARVKVPADLLGRHLQVGDSDRWVSMDDLISANLDMLFPGVEVLESSFFRVTRNADISVTADLLDAFDDDLLSAVESGLRQRRFGAVTRLEVASDASEEIRAVLLDKLSVDSDDMYEVAGPLDIQTWCDLERIAADDEGMALERLPQARPLAFANATDPADLFERLAAQDVLVHHPYDSFDDTVVAFVNAAAEDPDVQAIKMTLYRTSGDGTIVDALIRAAEAGKQVVVVVELKARFDEAANILWARQLETVGVHVAYGFVAMKVHSKVCLVVRREGDELRRYCHFGTGNYNSRTARLYTDMGLFTAEPQFGADLSSLFNSLTGFHVPVDYEELVVAPGQMRNQLLELIANEALYGSEGRIQAKMNALVDPEMIEALYAASAAGVRIELVVRGICCLRPGLAGLSETITVRSILGRYLEHARVYAFANGEAAGTPQILMGSADLMTRNLDRRVEVLVPVNDPDCRDELQGYLNMNLADDTRNWELQGDGSWLAPDDEGTCEMHVELHKRAGRAMTAGGAL